MVLPMHDGLRPCFLALHAVGPVVAVLALLRRRRGAAKPRCRVMGWRGYIPAALLLVEWLLPPALIFFGLGESPERWLPVRLLGFAVSLCGTALLVWASTSLGRFLVHEAATFQDHALITSGPYRLVRHLIYCGYLALLLGTCGTVPADDPVKVDLFAAAMHYFDRGARPGETGPWLTHRWAASSGTFAPWPGTARPNA